MLYLDEERFRLAIPVADAVSFAMGWSDLGYSNPEDAMRKIVGLLAIDELEYSEQWRTAGLVRTCLEHRWAELKT